MYAYAYRILRNEQDAFDAVSETFMKMVKFIDKVENTPEGREKSLNLVMIALRTIVQNTAISQFNERKKRAERFVPMTYVEDGVEKMHDYCDPSADTEGNFVKREDARALYRAIDRLTPCQRDAVNLVYFAGFSGPEAAEYLGIEPSALRSRLKDAREKLKKILLAEGGDYREYGAKYEENKA